MKYIVCLAVYVEKYVTVEADSEEEAEEKAQESKDNSFSLCNYCSQEFSLANSSGEAVSVELVDESAAVEGD